MNLPAERHNYILNLLREHGFVSVSDLSTQLDVSDVTIRRDLRALEERRFLFRTHGGATVANHVVRDRPVSEKAGHYADEKRRIGEAAAQLIEAHDAVMLASGTTMIEVARHLQPTPHLTVVTNAVNVALELTRLRDVDVYMLGGAVRLTSTSVVGPAAEDMLRHFACRKLFLGVDGIDFEYGLTTSNAPEAHLNAAMIRAARQTIVVTDSSKFGLRSFGRIADLSDIDRVITDSGVSDAVLRRCEEIDLPVQVV